MNNEKRSKKDLYYTPDHDWVNFQGAIAYVGICPFKLTGFKKIHQLFFQDPKRFYKQGEIIATIIYNDYQVELRMPVDGELLQINEQLKDNHNPVLEQPEGAGWLALIVPAQPYERRGLILPKDYQLNGKDKHAKS
jgi:glycine cleavage system H protein